MTYKIGSVFDVSFHLFYPEVESDDDFGVDEEDGEDAEAEAAIEEVVLDGELVQVTIIREEDGEDAEAEAAIEEVVLEDELVQVTIICEEEMSLSSFVAQLEQVKLAILKDKGFIEDEPVKVEIIKVEDISQQDFAVLPQCDNPDEEPVARPGLSVKVG